MGFTQKGGKKKTEALPTPMGFTPPQKKKRKKEGTVDCGVITGVKH